MRLLDRGAGDGGDLVEIAAGQVVQTVAVGGIGGNGIRSAIGSEGDDRLHQTAGAVLDVLAHGVQVGVIFHAGGVNAQPLLALALAVELLPPLGHHTEARLIAGEDLHGFAAAVQGLTGGGVLPAGVFLRAQIHVRQGFFRGADHRAHILSGRGKGKKAHGGENAVAPAHVVGNHEALPACGIGGGFESASPRVGGGKDPLRGFLLAVFADQKILENAETHGRLQSGTGFGDHVDAEIPVAQALESVAYGQGRKPRAGEQQFDSVTFAAEEIPCGARSEIGSAYANHDQRVALGADPGRGGLDAGKLAGEHAVGQLKPAGKVRAGSAPLRESAVGLFAFSPVGALVTPESGRAGQIYFYHVG